MTDTSNSEDPKVNPYVQDIGRTEERTTFEQEYLLKSEHEDPDKHWIGETLPAPSVGLVRASGAETTVGKSPFPARADHTHDNEALWGVFTGAQNGIAPGAIFLNSLSYFNGYNFLAPASTQIVLLPRTGVYIVVGLLEVNREDGALFVGQLNIRGWYNSASSRLVYRNSNLNNEQPPRTINWIESYHPTSVGETMQWAVEHNEPVNVNVIIHSLHVQRISSLDFTAP